MQIGSFGVYGFYQDQYEREKGWFERFAIDGSIHQAIDEEYAAHYFGGAVDFRGSYLYHRRTDSTVWVQKRIEDASTSYIEVPDKFYPTEVDFWGSVWGQEQDGSRFCRVDPDGTVQIYDISTLATVSGLKLCSNSATLFISGGSKVALSLVSSPTQPFKIFMASNSEFQDVYDDYDGALITEEYQSGTKYLRRRNLTDFSILWSHQINWNEEIAISTCGTLYVPNGKIEDATAGFRIWRSSGSITGILKGKYSNKVFLSAAIDRYKDLYIFGSGWYGGIQKYKTSTWNNSNPLENVWGSFGKYGRRVRGDFSGYRNLHLATTEAPGTETFFQVGSYEMSINWDMFGPEASSASCLYETAINGTGATEVVQLKGTYPLYSEFGSFVSGVIDLGENWIATSFSWGATEISNSTVGSIIDGTRKFFYRTSEYPPMWNSNGSPWKNYDFPIGNDSVFGSSAPWYPIASGESIPANKSRRYIQFMFPLWS